MPSRCLLSPITTESCGKAGFYVARLHKKRLSDSGKANSRARGSGELAKRPRSRKSSTAGELLGFTGHILLCCMIDTHLVHESSEALTRRG